MSILSGFSRFKRYRKTSDGYKLSSEWTSSDTVEMNDGNTAETNLGAIQGITSSLATDNSNYALSASGGKDLQDQITALNSNISKKSITVLNNLSSIVLSQNTVISLSTDCTNFDEIHISCYAELNSGSHTRKFILIDNINYMQADKGVYSKYICGGIYYDDNYNAEIGFAISEDGKSLIVTEIKCVGYTDIKGAYITGIKY